MSSNLEFHIASLTATAAIAAYVPVKLDGTTAGAVVVAGVNDSAIGITMANAAAGTVVPVRLLNGYGTASVVANAAIAVNAAVCIAAATGFVDDSGVGPIIGFALQGATAQGDVIEILIKGAVGVSRASASQAVVALTSVQNATAAATDLTTTEALANALKTNYNALQVDVAAINVLLTQLRLDLIAQGIVKGAA